MSPRLAAAVLAALTVLVGALFEVRGRVPFTSDQAAVALMAEDIRQNGSHPVFYYGSEYAGTLEPHYLAAVFALAGPSPLAFRAAMGRLVVLCVLAAFGAARLAFGGRAGFLAGLYLAAGPSFFFYKGLTSDGAYTSLLLLSGLALALLVAVEARFARGESAALLLWLLGLVLGLAWWVHSPAAFLGPVLLASALAGHTRRWLAPANLGRVVLGVAVGSAPWWARNIETGLASLRSAEMATATASRLGTQALALLTEGWTTLLGGHSVWALVPTFPGGPGLALVVLAGALSFGAWAAVRGRTPAARHGAVVFTAAVLSLSLLCLMVSRTDFTEPRYLFAGYAGLAPLIGGALDALWPRRLARLLALAALATLNFGSEVLAPVMKHRDRSQPEWGDYDVARLPGELLMRGTRSVYTSYWLAYKLAFLTQGRVAATPLGTGARGLSRIPALREAVDQDGAAGFLLVGEDAERFQALLEARGLPARAEKVDAYSLFTHVAAPLRGQVRACRCIPTPLGRGEIALRHADGPKHLAVNETALYRVGVENGSRFTVSDNVHLSYHWIRPDGSTAIWDGDRSTSSPWPAPGSEGTMEIRVRANLPPGTYRLVFDVVDEGITWLGRSAGRLPEASVEVVAR